MSNNAIKGYDSDVVEKEEKREVSAAKFNKISVKVGTSAATIASMIKNVEKIKEKDKKSEEIKKINQAIKVLNNDVSVLNKICNDFRDHDFHFGWNDFRPLELEDLQ